jgi:prepilin-type N-terminal cleavage/methylation domain-containing protein
MNINNRGFSLVEVIVVGVIIGILSAVAIPSYLGYVNSTKQEAVNNLAQTAAAAANSYFRRTGNNPTVAQLNLFFDANKYTITVCSPSVTVTDKSKCTITSTVAYRQ